ncbi:MAG: prenyltransferase/squalene oxidase repeat-containing protein [Promethearchaeia archaeon]
MKINHKLRYILIVGIIFIISISIVLPVVLAKTRKTYLTDYLLDNEKDTGFTNSLKSDDISYKATGYALEMLDFFELYEEPQLFGDAKINVNVSVFQTNLKNELTDFVKTMHSVYDLYYLLRANELVNSSISSSVRNDIELYISNMEQQDGGFGPTNTSTSANLISTSYSIKILDVLDMDIDNADKHKDFILSCINSNGGFGGNTSLDSTVANTYYALNALQILGDLDEISDAENTIEYLNGYYVDNQADEVNYGGFLPGDESEFCLLSSTFFAIESIKLLDENELPNESTTEWVLNKQNFKDGGFFNYNGLDDQETSAVTNTYYAFHILKTYDEDLLYLDENVWMVEFNWVVLIIILVGIGAVIGFGVWYWQQRRI